jgi:plastocyanin
VVLAAAAVLLVPAALADGTLTGSVSDPFNIAGPKGTVAPGAYTFEVDDNSAEHSFHLRGPGVDQATTVEGTGHSTWQVTLQEGAYSYVCDVHESMRGSFSVSTSPTPPPAPAPAPPPAPSPPPPPAPKPAAAKLLASVGPGARISLTTSAGRRVRTLSPGLFALTVSDRSAVDNFHLKGPGVDRKTGVSAKTKVTWTVRLQKGVYVFRSDAHPSLKGSVAVKAPAPA